MSTLPKCNVITSNLAKTFNSYICKARTKLIIDMLEEIRSCLMDRMFRRNDSIGKWVDSICSRIMKQIEESKKKIKYYVVKPAVGNKFQVSCGEEKYVVWLSSNAYSCIAWDLIDIPCSHALACIFFIKYNVEDCVNPYYNKRMYLTCYENAIEPINGPNMWPKLVGTPILPPEYKKMPRRPKKNRKKKKTSLKEKVQVKVEQVELVWR